MTRRAILFSIIFLAGLLIADRFIGSLLQPYVDIVTRDARQQYGRITHTDVAGAVVFVGDSHTLDAVDADRFSQLCACASTNLAMTGTNAMTAYYIVSELMRRPPTERPRLVVLQASWKNLTDQPDGWHKTLLLDEPVSEQVFYFRNSWDFRYVMQVISLSYRNRRAIKRFAYRDASVPPPYSRDGQAYDRDAYRAAQSGRVSAIAADDVQSIYLARTLELLRRDGVQVVAIQPPETYENFSVAAYPEFAARLRDVTAAHDVPFFDFNDAHDEFVHDESNFADEEHVGYAGERLFTEELWRRLRPLMAADGGNQKSR